MGRSAYRQIAGSAAQCDGRNSPPEVPLQGSIVKLSSFACAVVGALVVAATAAAANGPLPWAGGVEAVSEFEGKASVTLSEYAQRQVDAICASPEEWGQIGAVQGFDPSLVWGLTPFDDAGPLDFAVVSPQACLAASEWVYATDRRGQKWCVTGHKTEYRSESVRRTRTEYRMQTRSVVKRKNGKRVRVQVRVRVAVKVPYTTTQQVPYDVPVESVCPDYIVPKLFGWQTLIHEGTHLAGVMNEAETDCFAMQNLPWFTWKMGIEESQAREIGVDYWNLFYVPYRPQTPDYFSAECRDGGALDLSPGSHDWPLLRVAPELDGAAEVAKLLEQPVDFRATVH
jgi:hypothetical protein